MLHAGILVCSAGFSSLRLALVWLCAKTLGLNFLHPSSLPRNLPEAASLMQVPATLTLNSCIHSDGLAELHLVEAQDILCVVLSSTVLGWRYQNCLSAGGKWFCPLQYNTPGYVAFAQMVKHASVGDLEQFWVNLNLRDAMGILRARECPCPSWQSWDVSWVGAVMGKRRNLSFLSVQEQLLQG